MRRKPLIGRKHKRGRRVSQKKAISTTHEASSDDVLSTESAGLSNVQMLSSECCCLCRCHLDVNNSEVKSTLDIEIQTEKLPTLDKETLTERTTIENESQTEGAFSRCVEVQTDALSSEKFSYTGNDKFECDTLLNNRTTMPARRSLDFSRLTSSERGNPSPQLGDRFSVMSAMEAAREDNTGLDSKDDTPIAIPEKVIERNFHILCAIVFAVLCAVLCLIKCAFEGSADGC